MLGRPSEALDIALQMSPDTDTDFWFRSYLKPVRADPRFTIVARRQGLVAIWRATDIWPDFCSDSSLTYDCRRTAALDDMSRR